MINFHNIFNSFRAGGGNSSINDLIDDPNTTIDRLLDEDAFINQIKSSNSKVNQYMTYDKYQTLVHYVTQVGPEDDRKRSYKYPLSVCDILSSDSQTPIEFFFPESQLYITQKIEERPQEKTQTEEIPEQTKITSVQRIQEPEQDAYVTETKQTKEKQESESTEQKTQQKEQTTKQPEAVEEETKVQHQNQGEQEKPIKTVQKEVQPLSNQLFKYFEGEVNYTLAGYVSKIFGAFLTKKPIQVIQFLLGDRFSLMLNHIESRSVTELVVKILTHQSNECLVQRKKAFQNMLERASKSAQVYVFSNLSAAICEVIEKVATALKATSNQHMQNLSKLYFNPQIVTKVITNVMSDQQNISVYNAPILHTYLTNVPLVIPENAAIMDDLKILLQSFVAKALQKLKITRQSKSLGLGRVKIVQVMSFVLKQNIFQSQNIAANESQFFTTLFRLCQKYQFNNILHNQVVKVIEIALSQTKESSFLQKLINENSLMEFLTEQTKEDMKIRAGEGRDKVRKGYIGHIVEICRKLQEYGEKNELVKNLIEKPEFEFIMQNLVNKEVYESNKNLGGYGMNRTNKNTIMFMKEEVIQEHLKFLSETPPSVFQPEPQESHINIEHPDLGIAQHQQMQGPTLADLVQGEIETEEQVIDPKYWDRHIEYNVDDLMNDL